jgi:copper chaperone CopZ
MKPTLLFPLILLFFLCTPATAAETHYRANLTGVECNGCKKSISKAIGRLKGVKTIRISKISEKTHQMTVITDGSKSLSQFDAVRALGKNAPHYKIVSWTKVR